jgi:hypothetical protein
MICGGYQEYQDPEARRFPQGKQNPGLHLQLYRDPLPTTRKDHMTTTLRDSWLSTGATQAEVYAELRGIFKGRSIGLETFKRALRGGKTPEDRTVAQINRAFAEVRRKSREQINDSK